MRHFEVELSDTQWQLIEPLTLGRPGLSGATGRDNRLFVNAVLYRTRSGIPWRELPERFGNWNTIARRFRRWAMAGVWRPIFIAAQVRNYEYEWALDY
ncbi:MAG TPA: transposase [Hymenobacter sp.]|uniref:transposase n=1 Tax=Hymenobacter sp. TaxID=1898978 RepID=UPI002D807E18|nr:transposase [Hymenobacter sp.]HET9505362.1 transposase [Hymenobacter sp.]